MRVFVTGGSGVLGRALMPLLRDRGDEVVAPGRTELDLFDPAALAPVVAATDAVVHLATRIPPRSRFREPGAWDNNDRLRAVASRLLVDAALAAARPAAYVQVSIAFGLDTPFGASAVEAERQAARFAAAGRRGVVVRIGLLYGPGAATAEPDRGPGLPVAHVDVAARALRDALEAPSGTYEVAE
ncbi:MAG TPA: NAD-dependent epimerase/dehydratase family protein [Frankiaceae bacterium]|nr:NAD-dependent epimerase/dehydratase family protein [Frankiaceae bacterium]